MTLRPRRCGGPPGRGAVGGLVHRPLRPRGGDRRRPRPGGGRLPGAGARRRHLLRADLDHDRPARHRPHDAPPHRRDAAPPGGRRDADRVEPSCTAALRSEALELVGRPPSASPPAPARSPSCSPPRPAGSRRRWRGWRSSRSRTATTPRSWAGRPTHSCWPTPAPASPASAAAAGWPATGASSAGTTTSRWRSRSSTCSGRAGHGHDDAVVLADGFSCRTQLDQLAGRRGLHLAELLADRLP